MPKRSERGFPVKSVNVLTLYPHITAGSTTAETRGKSGHIFNFHLHSYTCKFWSLVIKIFLVISAGYMSKKRLNVGEAGSGW